MPIPRNPARLRITLTPSVESVCDLMRRYLPDEIIQEEVARWQKDVGEEILAHLQFFHEEQVPIITGGAFLSIRMISGYRPPKKEGPNFTKRWVYVGYYPLRRVNPMGPDAGRPPGPLIGGYVRPWQVGVPAGRVHPPRRGIKVPGTIWLPRLVFWMQRRGITIPIRGITRKGVAKTTRKEQRRGRPGRRRIFGTLSPKQAAWVIARGLEKFGIRPNPIFARFLTERAAEISRAYERATEFLKIALVERFEARGGELRRLPKEFWLW